MSLYVHLEDRPGTLGKICQSLAGRGVNILAFRFLTRIGFLNATRAYA